MTMRTLKTALLMALLGTTAALPAQETDTPPLAGDDELRVDADVFPGIPENQAPGESGVNEYAFEPAFEEQSRKEREGFDMPPEPVGNILRMDITLPEAGD